MKLITAIINAETAILTSLESRAQFLAALRQDEELAKCRAQIDAAMNSLENSIMQASLDYQSVNKTLNQALEKIDKLRDELDALKQQNELRER